MVKVYNSIHSSEYVYDGLIYSTYTENAIGLIIIHRGIPKVYVGVDVRHPLANVANADTFVKVHGGFTYNSHSAPIDSLSKYNEDMLWLGWDYGHIYDYDSYTGLGKRYTKTELLTELHEALTQISKGE